MKILLFTDVHWSTYSSIVRKRGELFSQRLELLINSMNWVNKTAIEKNCHMMICAGDFFDKSQATDEELTALRAIEWNKLDCYFVCGNHESSVSDLRFNAIKALENEYHFIVDKQSAIRIPNNGGSSTEIVFLPYETESVRLEKPTLFERLGSPVDKRVIVSHNDIAGINYGGFESRIGFDINDIESSCNLFLNGHLHNSEFVRKTILNLGSLSAHNFTNDSTRYQYGVWVLDTATLNLEFIENPYSLNFYKFEINHAADISQTLLNVKNNAVVSLKTTPELAKTCETFNNENLSKLIELKITINRDVGTADTTENSIQELQVNHLEKFIICCKENIANTTILNQELAELCK